MRLGAVAVILSGAAAFGANTVAIGAFVGAVVSTTVVWCAARHEGRTGTVTVVLTGIAVNAFAQAATGVGVFVANDQQLRSIVFWTLGGLGGSTWATTRVLAPLLAVGGGVLIASAKRLDLLALGDREAGHLGVNVDRLRVTVILASALTVGASVAVAGIVSFVGLVVPHLARIVLGPSHRLLLPVCVLGGATLLVSADLLARTVAAPREVPLGVVTALLGGPYLLWLVRRNRTEVIGWG